MRVLSRRNLEWIGVLFLVTGTGWFTLRNWDLHPFNADAALFASHAYDIATGRDFPLEGSAARPTHGTVNMPPLYYYAIALPLWVFQSPWAIIQFTCVLHALVPGLLVLWGRRIVSPAVAWFAAVLYATDVTLLTMSRALLSYAIIAPFVVAFILTLLACVQNRGRCFLGVAILGGLLVQIHASTVLIVVAAGFVACFTVRGIRRQGLIVASMIALLLHAPYVVHEVTHDFENLRGAVEYFQRGGSAPTLERPIGNAVRGRTATAVLTASAVGCIEELQHTDLIAPDGWTRTLLVAGVVFDLGLMAGGLLFCLGGVWTGGCSRFFGDRTRAVLVTLCGTYLAAVVLISLLQYVEPWYWWSLRGFKPLIQAAGLVLAIGFVQDRTAGKRRDVLLYATASIMVLSIAASHIAYLCTHDTYASSAGSVYGNPTLRAKTAFYRFLFTESGLAPQQWRVRLHGEGARLLTEDASEGYDILKTLFIQQYSSPAARTDDHFLVVAPANLTVVPQAPPVWTTEGFQAYAYRPHVRYDTLVLDPPPVSPGPLTGSILPSRLAYQTKGPLTAQLTFKVQAPKAGEAVQLVIKIITLGIVPDPQHSYIPAVRFNGEPAGPVTSRVHFGELSHSIECSLELPAMVESKTIAVEATLEIPAPGRYQIDLFDVTAARK